MAPGGKGRFFRKVQSVSCQSDKIETYTGAKDDEILRITDEGLCLFEVSTCC